MRLAVVAASICMIVGFSFAQESQAIARKYTNIPAQGLGPALQLLANERNVQVVYVSEDVNGVQTAGAVGNLTLDEALSSLLTGTGLRFKYLDERTVTVHFSVPDQPAASKDATSTGAAKIDQGVVLSTAEGEGVAASRVNDAPIANSSMLAQLDGGDDPAQDISEVVVVTGTRIRGVAPESSPLSVYDREYIDRSGVGSVGQLLRTLPENFANVDPGTGLASNNNNGQNFGEGSAVDLHGVGPGATLVLINGHRMAPSGLNGSLVDVSLIPLSAIERVEVLTDGASALYGADAIAGVVNFVLRRDYDGQETSLRYGGSADGGGSEVGASQLFAGEWSSGSALLVLDYFDQDSLRGSERDFVPAFAADFELLPSQERKSVFASIHQFLGLSTKLSLDALASEREFENSYTDSLQTVESDGRTRSTGAALSASHDVNENWQIGADLNYARTQTELTQNFVTFGFVGEAEINSKVSSLDLRADGPLFAAPGGVARASVGVQARREEFDDLTTAIPSVGTNLKRDVGSVYGELFLPVVGDQNSATGSRRLEISLAGRYDDYDDVGSAFSPRVGVLWSPTQIVNLRATYAESFRAAPLAQLAAGNDSYFAIALPDPSSASGSTNTILSFAPGNPALEPEQSKSWTCGFDLFPNVSDGFYMSTSYFHIKYRDRISNPPTNFSDLYTQGNALDPFIDRNPTSAELDAIYAHPRFANPFGLAATDIGAIYDGRLQNIGESVIEGIDANAGYSFDAFSGTMNLSAALAYALDNSLVPAEGLDSVEVFDRFSYPVQMRIRGGGDWTNGRYGASLIANYVDAYDNDIVVPNERIDSWLTFDLQLSFQAGTPERRFALSLSVQNLLNEDPPGFNFPPGTAYLNYDAANASPMGRFVSVQVSQQW